MIRCLETFSPTIEQVMDWAYDDDLYLTSQDEDLVLHANKYVAVLFKLASQVDCPKKDYCYSILYHYAQDLMMRRDARALQEIFSIIITDKDLKDPQLLHWFSDVQWVYQLLKEPRVITEDEVNRLTFLLTDNFDITLRAVKLGEHSSGLVEFAKHYGHYTDYFYVDPQVGDWKISKFKRLA
ncbi:hypothetical protein [Dyadobacter sp. CY323]|uniref:hypothetical protein n=1 Tax=Dyadobacter sp. CY323 TaxID=2907302 RepID=UPI001F42D41C|nr:hypothetical protein [Dyadobacter sp. CY323]MCE6991309.1 hypothetical protein [Dyadobacter sp. CY323]